MSSSGPVRIHYHRDFDGMVSAAVLANALRERRGETPAWSSVNYDQRDDWINFSSNERFAIVDFHFHPRAEYWFDHHPTTFLTPELRAAYVPNERWQWDETSPSCPPLILAHAERHWGFVVPERFREMAEWSNVIDAARYKSVDQAVFGDTSALRIARALTAAPSPNWTDELVEAMAGSDLDTVAKRADVDKCFQRAARNRDKALQQFPPTVEWRRDHVLVYDASSSQIRRERFAAFYHYPDVHYSVGVIPTRSGFHVMAGENPWNPPPLQVHIGEIMERYGGGGHKAVGGANPPDLQEARRIAMVIGEELRQALLARKA
ncbi:MAG: hypothetical protein NTV21_21235 [Planctomycetota bacterium]|nr:hypothetical protein [Planctomycetota bacterium]